MLIVNYQEEFAYNMSYEDDVYSVAVKLNEQQSTISKLTKENEKLQKQVEFSETTSNATSNYNAFLESKITTLEKENDDFHKSIKEYEDLRKRLNKDKSRLIEEKMSLDAFVIEKGLMEEYMRWENE